MRSDLEGLVYRTIGVACSADSVPPLIQPADEWLDQSKRSGRNQVS